VHTQEELPTTTKANIEYGKLSKTSALALDRELRLCGLSQYKFRSAHESIMAIIGIRLKPKERRKSNYQLADESIRSNLQQSRQQR